MHRRRQDACSALAVTRPHAPHHHHHRSGIGGLLNTYFAGTLLHQRHSDPRPCTCTARTPTHRTLTTPQAHEAVLARASALAGSSAMQRLAQDPSVLQSVVHRSPELQSLLAQNPDMASLLAPERIQAVLELAQDPARLLHEAGLDAAGTGGGGGGGVGGMGQGAAGGMAEVMERLGQGDVSAHRKVGGRGAT